MRAGGPPTGPAAPAAAAGAAPGSGTAPAAATAPAAHPQTGPILPQPPGVLPGQAGGAPGPAGAGILSSAPQGTFFGSAPSANGPEDGPAQSDVEGKVLGVPVMCSQSCSLQPRVLPWLGVASASGLVQSYMERNAPWYTQGAPRYGELCSSPVAHVMVSLQGLVGSQHQRPDAHRPLPLMVLLPCMCPLP